MRTIACDRLWADGEGRLLGGEMPGPSGEPLAHLLDCAIRDGLTGREMRDRPVHHPTVEDGLAGALSEIVHATHRP